MMETRRHSSGSTTAATTTTALFPGPTNTANNNNNNSNGKNMTLGERVDHCLSSPRTAILALVSIVVMMCIAVTVANFYSTNFRGAAYLWCGVVSSQGDDTNNISIHKHVVNQPTTNNNNRSSLPATSSLKNVSSIIIPGYLAVNSDGNHSTISISKR